MKLLDRWKVGSFGRNVLTLMSGTAGAQALLIVASVALTRLYSAEEFGTFAVFTAVLNIVSKAGGLRYQRAIVLQTDDDDAINLTVMTLVLGVLLALIAVPVMFYGQEQILSWAGVEGDGSWLLLVPIALLAFNTAEVLGYWELRAKGFKRLAASKIAKSGGMVSSQVGLGFVASMTPIGLIVGNVVGIAAGAAVLGWNLIANWGRVAKASSWSAMKRLAVKYKRFPLYSMPNTAANTLSAMWPLLLLARLFDPKIAGLYFLAHRSLVQPSGVIRSAYGQVLFQNLSERYYAGHSIAPTIKRGYSRLARLMIVPSLSIMALGPHIFAFVFGEEWRQAGEYARWIAPWHFAAFVVSPSMNIFSTINREDLQLAYQFGLMFLRLGALLVGAKFLGDLGTIMAYSAVGFVMNAGMGVYVYAVARDADAGRHESSAPRDAALTGSAP